MPLACPQPWSSSLAQLAWQRQSLFRRCTDQPVGAQLPSSLTNHQANSTGGILIGWPCRRYLNCLVVPNSTCIPTSWTVPASLLSKRCLGVCCVRACSYTYREHSGGDWGGWSWEVLAWVCLCSSKKDNCYDKLKSSMDQSVTEGRFLQCKFVELKYLVLF